MCFFIPLLRDVHAISNPSWLQTTPFGVSLLAVFSFSHCVPLASSFSFPSLPVLSASLAVLHFILLFKGPWYIFHLPALFSKAYVYLIFACCHHTVEEPSNAFGPISPFHQASITGRPALTWSRQSHWSLAVWCLRSQCWVLLICLPSFFSSLLL